MNDILLYISLGLAILWAIRMAQSKRRNPILWAGVTFGLMLIPTVLAPSLPPILGIAPLLILVFLRPKKLSNDLPRTDTVVCPKCSAIHASGYNYCVNCGWELNEAYSELLPNPELTNEPTLATTIERDQSGHTPAASIPSADHALISENISEDDANQNVPIPNDSTAPGSLDTDRPVSTPKGPESVPIPRPTTAIGFTDLGLSLSKQGRFRESIDQFTKAIALNSNYIPAWENRAESYKVLGLLEKSLSDTSQVEQLRSS
ncbi:MAG: hypothetical protein VX966_09465 [Chloroflexota bacterium]|nr:hypothetical protein [Chloroflexota bacterium]